MAAWAPSFLPLRSASVATVESFLTSSACVASKYGSEKRMAFLRSSVMVMPAAAMSHLPVDRS